MYPFLLKITFQYARFAHVACQNSTSPILKPQHFAEVGAYWIREYDIDGWSLMSQTKCIKFWRTFRTAVRKENRRPSHW